MRLSFGWVRHHIDVTSITRQVPFSSNSGTLMGPRKYHHLCKLQHYCCNIYLIYADVRLHIPTIRNHEYRYRKCDGSCNGTCECIVTIEDLPCGGFCVKRTSCSGTKPFAIAILVIDLHNTCTFLQLLLITDDVRMFCLSKVNNRYRGKRAMWALLTY